MPLLLYPTPHTLYRIPNILYRIPITYTLHPELLSLNPTPLILRYRAPPMPSLFNECSGSGGGRGTLNPKPYIINPKP